MLVGTPGAPEFCLPTAVDREGICRAAQRAAVRYSFTFAVMLFFAGLPVLGLAFWFRYFGSPPYWQSLSLAVCGVIFAIDARAQKESLGHLHDRALFFYWLRSCSRAEYGARVYIGLLILMAGTQWWTMQPSGTLEPAFDAYGVLYPRVMDGEMWRLLTGPYLHYSLVHFALNAVLLVLLGALAWAYWGWWSLVNFAVGCSLSLTTQMLFGAQVYDNAGGISGGVYALAGLVLGATLHRPWKLPQGLAPQLLVLMLLAIVLMELASDAAATVAHFTGLGFGLVVGAALAFRERRL